MAVSYRLFGVSEPELDKVFGSPLFPQPRYAKPAHSVEAGLFHTKFLRDRVKVPAKQVRWDNNRPALWSSKQLIVREVRAIDLQFVEKRPKENATPRLSL